MKLIIAGGRHFSDTHLLREALYGFSQQITQVIDGGATGADALGKAWATAQGIPVETFPANWTKHGKAAGPIRNREMAEYADELVAFWDGSSRGTDNMIQTMRDLRKPYHVYFY